MAADLDAFYSDEPIDLWKQIIGDDLHYHFGYYEGTEDLATAARGTVQNLYPYVSPGDRVLDVGCGWGGPARQLTTERECVVEGITISSAQAEYCRQLGLAVRQADVERETIDNAYDVALFLQSSEHIRDKVGVLRRMRECASRLVVSATCVAEDYPGRDATFGGSIAFCSVSELQQILDEAGWRTRSVRHWREQSLPSLFHWKHNLDRVFGKSEPPGQLAVLRSLTDLAIQDLGGWCRAFPLVDIVAE